MQAAGEPEAVTAAPGRGHRTPSRRDAASLAVVRRFDVKRYAPLLLLAVLVITPLAIWAATSGGNGDDQKGSSTSSARWA